jgi:hypothetical protein
MTAIPTQTDVMLALLTLDAYSRGTNPQLTYNQGTELSRQIGIATWTAGSDDIAGAIAAGFRLRSRMYDEALALPSVPIEGSSNLAPDKLYGCILRRPH